METNRVEKLDLAKIEAEIAKLMADTAKVNKDIKWYEAGVIVAATLAVVAVVKLFL